MPTRISSSGNEFTVLPHTLVNLARFVHQFSPARALPVYPISQVNVSVRVNISPVPMVNIILELTFVHDHIDLFTHALNSTIGTNLTDNKLIKSTLAKLETLINRLIRISHDVLKLKRS